MRLDVDMRDFRLDLLVAELQLARAARHLVNRSRDSRTGVWRDLDDANAFAILKGLHAQVKEEAAA